METKPKFTRREVATAKNIYELTAPSYEDHTGRKSQPFDYRWKDKAAKTSWLIVARWHLAELAKQKGKVEK